MSLFLHSRNLLSSEHKSNANTAVPLTAMKCLEPNIKMVLVSIINLTVYNSSISRFGFLKKTTIIVLWPLHKTCGYNKLHGDSQKAGVCNKKIDIKVKMYQHS